MERFNSDGPLNYQSCFVAYLRVEACRFAPRPADSITFIVSAEGARALSASILGSFSKAPKMDEQRGLGGSWSGSSLRYA